MGLEGADSKIPASAAPSRLSSAALSSDPMAASWRPASAAVAAARLSSASQCSVANGSADVGEGQTRGSLIVVIVDEKGRRRESMVRDLPAQISGDGQIVQPGKQKGLWPRTEGMNSAR